jgi:hypothetical protein
MLDEATNQSKIRLKTKSKNSVRIRLKNLKIRLKKFPRFGWKYSDRLTETAFENLFETLVRRSKSLPPIQAARNRDSSKGRNTHRDRVRATATDTGTHKQTDNTDNTDRPKTATRHQYATRQSHKPAPYLEDT